MNIIGGIVFVLATVVFIMELAGDRPYLTSPFIRKNTTVWDAMALIKMAGMLAHFVLEVSGFYCPVASRAAYFRSPPPVLHTYLFLSVCSRLAPPSSLS